MTPFETRLLSLIREIARDTGRPVRTVSLVARTGLPERTLRVWLQRLEGQGAIKRLTPKTGWIAVGSALDRRVEAARETGLVDFLKTAFRWHPCTAIRAAA